MKFLKNIFLRTPKKFNLTKKDFKLKETDLSNVDIRISPEFEKKMEESWIKKKKTKTNSKKVFRSYSTIIKIDKSKVEITFNPDEVEDIDSFIKNINEKLNWISLNILDIKTHIAKNLLDLKNNSWLSEGQDKITKEEFIKKLNTIEDIGFNPDLSFLIYFDDNDLFLGHLIKQDISKNLELRKPCIVW